MNVHIVANRVEGDWIIARLAHHLVERWGWGWSQKPERKADVNIFFPYLEWRHTAWHSTLTAAWMTHRREGDWGERVWENTAQALSLRVTPAALYVPELEQYGRTAHIPHPVELNHFTIEGRGLRDDKQFIVGVSGMVYPDGRKGEGMVARLIAERWRVRASGKGWPCPVKWYRWQDLPKFYRSIDCYLCTATIEGGPVTVLEALACGTPVVIPSGVGECDEYPEMDGIAHYQAGDYEDMKRALRRVQDNWGEPEALREVAAQYTVERWCREWKREIETLIGGAHG